MVANRDGGCDTGITGLWVPRGGVPGRDRAARLEGAGCRDSLGNSREDEDMASCFCCVLCVLLCVERVCVLAVVEWIAEGCG